MNYLLYAYRHLYMCCRRTKKLVCPAPERLHKPVIIHPPWLWIGVKTEEGSRCFTNQVNRVLSHGTHVTPSFLNEITGTRHGTWRYIDAKTLEERDFPSEGITIEDARHKSISDSE